MVPQRLEQRRRIGDVDERLAYDRLPAASLALFAGPACRILKIDRLLGLKRLAKTIRNFVDCQPRSELAPVPLIRLRRRRVGVDQRSNGIEQNRGTARLILHRSTLRAIESVASRPCPTRTPSATSSRRSQRASRC